MAASVPVVIASNQSAVPVDTELPAAAALSDTTANPTTSLIGSLLHLWDGSSNWVRTMFDHATNKALRVSNYGKSSAAGDTPILVDSSGRQVVVGAVASGSAVQGSPVLVGGSDGTNARTMYTDSTGQVALHDASGTIGDGRSNNSFRFADASGNLVYQPVELEVYNGASWDRLRTPNTFKTVTAASSGDTAVWTSAVSKKWRLLRLMITVTGNATTASGGNFEILMRDVTAAIGIAFSVNIPTVAVGNQGFSTGWIDLGNGILAAATNTALNVNLSAALSTGEIRVIACGTEE